MNGRRAKRLRALGQAARPERPGYRPEVGETVVLRPDAAIPTFFDQGAHLTVKAVTSAGVVVLLGESSFTPDPFIQYATIYDVAPITEQGEAP